MCPYKNEERPERISEKRYEDVRILVWAIATSEEGPMKTIGRDRGLYTIRLTKEDIEAAKKLLEELKAGWKYDETRTGSALKEKITEAEAFVRRFEMEPGLERPAEITEKRYDLAMIRLGVVSRVKTLDTNDAETAKQYMRELSEAWNKDRSKTGPELMEMIRKVEAYLYYIDSLVAGGAAMGSAQSRLVLSIKIIREKILDDLKTIIAHHPDKMVKDEAERMLERLAPNSGEDFWTVYQEAHHFVRVNPVARQYIPKKTPHKKHTQ